MLHFDMKKLLCVMEILRMASGSFTVDEVVGLLDDDSDLAELEGLDLDNDSDSDDGDREETEFTSISGTEELVSTSLLRATATQEEEPAFQDSLLLLDDDLETPTSVDNFTETDSNYSESDSSSVASSDQASDSEVTYHSRAEVVGAELVVEGVEVVEEEEPVVSKVEAGLAEAGVEAGAEAGAEVVSGVEVREDEQEMGGTTCLLWNGSGILHIMMIRLCHHLQILMLIMDHLIEHRLPVLLWVFSSFYLLKTLLI